MAHKSEGPISPVGAVGGLTFGDALYALKKGQKVARAGWNGKGMWLFLISAPDWQPHNVPTGILGLEKLPWIAMKTADNKVVPWLCSQTDALAEDWTVIRD
jgi:hypothetical protein